MFPMKLIQVTHVFIGAQVTVCGCWGMIRVSFIKMCVQSIADLIPDRMPPRALAVKALAFLSFFGLVFLYIRAKPIQAYQTWAVRRGLEANHNFNVLISTDSAWFGLEDSDPQTLMRLGCPLHNCRFSRQLSYKPEHEPFHMVLFVGENAVISHVNRMEWNRSVDQVYGMLLLEPPHIVPNLRAADNKINWTIGYRHDADIHYPYRQIYDKATHLPATVFREPAEEEPLYLGDANMIAVVENKTKMVAWFVSNCNRVQSGRMQLARALSQHIPVDIYGKCGPLKCDKSQPQKCYEMLDTDYKFYLSFENALCEDYITEKAFDVMQRNIIPVIYSGADLKRVLPPMSYINAEDFATPQELAEYLTFLANNPLEYLQYFWWKQYYYVAAADWRCLICQALNDEEKQRRHVWYPSVEDWYKKDRCRSPKIVF